MYDWNTPAHIAVRRPWSPALLELLELLLQHGASFDIANRRRDTPLHEASARSAALRVRGRELR